MQRWDRYSFLATLTDQAMTAYPLAGGARAAKVPAGRAGTTTAWVGARKAMPVVSNETSESAVTLGTGGLVLLCQKQQDVKS